VTLRQVSLAIIDPDGFDPSDLPDDFVQSIRRFGVLQPVTLLEHPVPDAYTYKIIAGRRRVAAAFRAGLLFIPATVLPRETPTTVVAAMMLTENYQRGENPIVDLRAIQILVAAGVQETEIARHLGMSVSQVRSRRALANLTPVMRNALVRGELSVRLANQVARMPASSQRALRRIWGSSHEDEITPAMVERAAGQHDPESAMDTVVELTRPAPNTFQITGLSFDHEPERTWLSTPLQAPAITRINDHLIEADGQRFISFQHHQDIVQRLENRIATARAAVSNVTGVEPVAGTQMMRYNNATYITLEEHNRLVTEATRRRQPVESATERRSHVQQAIERARREGFAEGQQSVAPQPAARIQVPNGLTREEIIERIASDRSYTNAIALIEAAVRAMPAEPNRRSDELHEALGLVRDMVAHAA
jgi:ParB/RepB/Spo0J family partition protein